MIAADPGDRIDMGDGRPGIVVKVLGAGLYRLSCVGGGHRTVSPDYRAAVDRGYFARMVAEAEAAETVQQTSHRRRPPVQDV